jgi:hypothetical protein
VSSLQAFQLLRDRDGSVPGRLRSPPSAGRDVACNNRWSPSFCWSWPGNCNDFCYTPGHGREHSGSLAISKPLPNPNRGQRQSFQGPAKIQAAIGGLLEQDFSGRLGSISGPALRCSHFPASGGSGRQHCSQASGPSPISASPSSDILGLQLPSSRSSVSLWPSSRCLM